MKRIFLIIAIALFTTSCVDYLDKSPDATGMTEDDVFTNYLNFRQFEDRMYKDMHDYLADYDYTFIAAFCDEGYTESVQWETLPKAQNGDWLGCYNAGQALQFTNVWNSWQSIRIANISLEELPKLKGVASTEEIKLLKGQALFMRAWYHYEFLKRQGGMPYITNSLAGTDNFALPRLSYEETALKIAADCDSAMALLPKKWDDANLGRPTIGAAMAVKASVLLFSASPTNNVGDDKAKWEKAAQASWDLINYSESNGIYKLVPCNSTAKITYKTPTTIETISYTGGYDSIFNYVPYNDEIIWENFGNMQNGNRYTTFSVPSLASGGIIQGYSPTKNIVDMFETKNGLSIKDDATYSDQNPFINRDPRFYSTILFNQERWTSKTDLYLELFNGGKERNGKSHYSYTGFLSRKFWVNNVDQFSKAQHPISHCIYFRYADILLQYAEAANELGGPNYKLAGANLTALEAVNRIRARVKMPGIDARYLASKETFRERIKNERAIELYLEGKRFFDLSRWGDASKKVHKELYGMDIAADASKPTGYTFSQSPSPIFTLTFDQKHYRWPIKMSDATMFYEFKQNPGW